MKDKNKLINIVLDKKNDEKYGKNHNRNKILVNLITAVRSLGTIAIIPIFANYGPFIAGLAAMGFFLTDFIDGQLARKLHVESFFGSILDGLSDKTFGIVCLILLGALNPLYFAIIGVELGILAINYKSIKDGNNAQSSKEGKAKTLLLAASIVGGYFCYSMASIKVILNYVNVSTFNTLLQMNPNLLSSILAIPALGASIYVAADYKKKADASNEKRKQLNDNNVDQVTPDLDETSTKKITIEEIQAQRAQLLSEKKALISVKYEEQTRKNNEELLHDLFDTEFYHQHRNDEIKTLIYKKK